MTMTAAEWEGLSALWHGASEGIDPTSLRRLVTAQRRRLVGMAVAEGVLVVAFAVLSWWVAADGVHAWEAIWLVTLWTFTLAAWGFAMWNRRGTWRSLGESVLEHVRLSRLRAQRTLRATAFAYGLLAAEDAAVVAQLYWFGRLSGFALALLAAANAAVAAGCWLSARRARQELAMLDACASALENGIH